MKRIIFVIAYIVLNDISTTLGQDYFFNLNDDFYPHTTRYRSPQKFRGRKNATIPKLFPEPRTSVDNAELFSSRYGKIVDCRGMTLRIHKMGKEASCKARKTLVKLNPDLGYTYLPETILVDRCDGPCARDSLSCMPIESIYTKVLVFRTNIATSETSCYELKVEKHTRCRCGCDLMPSDCNFRQTYDNKDCTCKCNNMDEEKDCYAKEGMYWNRDACRCSCTIDEETCSEGLTWIPSLCRCAKVMMDYNID